MKVTDIDLAQISRRMTVSSELAGSKIDEDVGERLGDTINNQQSENLSSDEEGK